MNKEQQDAYDKAQVMLHFAAGGVVEHLFKDNIWMKADSPSWYSGTVYRIAKPTLKKVKLLAWFDGSKLMWWKGNVDYISFGWKRVPTEDKEIEVEES